MTPLNRLAAIIVCAVVSITAYYAGYHSAMVRVTALVEAVRDLNALHIVTEGTGGYGGIRKGSQP